MGWMGWIGAVVQSLGMVTPIEDAVGWLADTGGAGGRIRLARHDFLSTFMLIRRC
jgi:hypothetical protein